MKKTLIKVVDDPEYAKIIRQKLKENSGYCPCRLVKNDDTKCMCKEFREQEEGTCHCGLYIKTVIDDNKEGDGF